MGRKKSNARSLPHGKKIHVNKYISKRGNTKKKVTAFEVPNSNVHPNFEELPAHRWPTARDLVRRAWQPLRHFGAERKSPGAGHHKRCFQPVFTDTDGHSADQQDEEAGIADSCCSDKGSL